MMGILDKQIEDAKKSPKFMTSKESQKIRVEEKVTKSKLLEQLKEKYPYGDSPFNKYRDRDPRQYSKLVSTRDLKIAEFVLKWEHEHGKRIHKNMAWEILTEIKEKNFVSDEIFKKLERKYEKTT